MSADYDLLIVGAGPAGLAAALAAAPSGARIALVDDNPAAGGQIWRDGPRASLPPRAHQMRQRLAGQANVEHFPATRVVACGPGRRLLLEDPQRGWQVGYRRLVLCTGARELLLPFPGWTLPGVTGAGGLQALAKGGLPLAGQRLVVAGSGPLLLASAASASQCGARLLRVAEQAPARTLAAFAVRLPRWPGKLWQAAGLFARSYRADSYVLAALGEERLKPCACAKAVGSARSPANAWPAASAWCPTCNSARPSAIASTARRSPSTNGRPAACPTTTPPANAPASAAANWPWWKAPSPAHAAVDERDAARRLWPRRRRWQGFADTLARHFALRAELRQLAEADTLVCRCEDVPLAALAGHAGWTEAKLHSRCGMGACQGRICGSAAQFLFGWTPPAPRPPFSPARLETLACWQGDAG